MRKNLKREMDFSISRDAVTPMTKLKIIPTKREMCIRDSSNIRIAPTYPPLDELKVAMELFCICAELAAAKKLLAE